MRGADVALEFLTWGVRRVSRVLRMLLTSHRQHWLAESYTRAAVSGDIGLLRPLANKFPISTRWGIDGVGMPEHPLDPAMYAAVRAGDNDLGRGVGVV